MIRTRGTFRAGFTLILRKAFSLEQKKVFTLIPVKGKGLSLAGFTLIELLVSIAIIGLLTALLVPTIDRSLSRNNLANDVDLLRSKIEETRLMAGSTQQADVSTGYYAVFFPVNVNYFSIIRVDDTPTDCPIGAAASQATTGGPCLIEKIMLSKGVDLINSTQRLLLFRSPTQQISESHRGLCGRNGCYTAPDGPPIFDSWDIKLQFKTKTATLNLENYTGKLKPVEYRNN